MLERHFWPAAGGGGFTPTGDLGGTSDDVLVETVKGGKTPLTADQDLADVESASTARTSLGLGSAATHASTDFDAAGAASTAQAAAIAASIPLSQKGAASGVMALDSGGSGAQPPKAHAASHAPGGSDPLTTADLPASVESEAPVWASATSNRAAVDILMSAYDTNPASTDHTTAFQNALNAAATIIANGASLVRIILDSRQKYTIGGAVTAGANGQFAQVQLPFSQTASGTIKLVGMPRGNDFSYISIGSSGTVIESTLTSAPAFQAARGIASIFGGPASFSTGTRGLNAFSAIKFATQDITIRQQANPVIAGIDCGWVHGFGFDGLLQFDTDQMAAIPGGFSFAFGSVTVCTNPQAIPLITPFPLDWNGTIGDNLVVSGWLCGPVIGEVVHIKNYFAFALPGCVVSLDNSKQASRIDYLTEWCCAYGVAQMTGQSVTPQGPSVAPAPGSNYTGTLAAPLSIGTWQGQTQAGGSAPAALARQYDVMDTDATARVRLEAEWMFATSGGTVLGAPIILGSGSSLTGTANGTRVRSKQAVHNRQPPSVPASGTALRNPFGRESLAIISGGTVTGVTVDSASNVISGDGSVVVPANGVITLTYSVAPTWVWQVL